MLKRLKPKHYIFIVLNILGILLEYFLFQKYLLVGLLNISKLSSLYITAGFFLIIAFINIYSTRQRKTIFEEVNESQVKDFHKQVIHDIKSEYLNKYDEEIHIRFVDGLIQPSVMFALRDSIYINCNRRYNYKRINDAHFKGVLAHEVGHVSHMPNIFILANVRPTSIIGNILFAYTFRLSSILDQKKFKTLKYLIFGFVYTFFIIFNILNLLILYPFKRYEERAADRLSLEFTNGYALRGYYYKLGNQYNSRVDRFRFNFIDFNHPTPYKHYLEMNNYIVNPITNCELISNSKIEVKEYINEDDRIHKLLDFYEKLVDKSIITMYMYIGRNYQEVNNLNKAKEYYLLAGENNNLVGYKKLIEIGYQENDISAIVKYYSILAEKGDKEAIFYTDYYEHDFYLYKLLSDEEESEFSLTSLRISLDNQFTLINEDKIKSGTVKRRRNVVTLQFEDGTKLNYYLKNGEIISQLFFVQKSEDEEPIKYQEFYKKS